MTVEAEVVEETVPRDWLLAAAQLTRAVFAVYGGPIAISDWGIVVLVTLAGDQGDALACQFQLMIPLPRKAGQVIARGKGKAGLYVRALEEEVRGTVLLWQPPAAKGGV